MSNFSTALKGKKASDVLVFGGGTIPKKDWPALNDIGVGKIFAPGSRTREIIDYLNIVLGAR